VNSGYDIQNEYLKDIQNYNTEFMQACGGAELPQVVDPRSWYRVEMQYALSSCVGNALTAPYEISYRQATGKIAQFSRMHAYLQAQKYSDMVQPGFRYFGRDGGALIAGARRAAIEGGVCFESTFAYPNAYSTHYPQGADSEGQTFKIRSSSLITNDSNGVDAYDQIKTYLGSGMGGILLGAPWPFNLDNNFTITNFRSYGREGHSWSIIGYLSDQRLIAVNSHSESYGAKGFMFLNRQGANELIANRSTVAVGLSDLSVPRGRKVDWNTESMFA
jgi:hypothetical protein